MKKKSLLSICLILCFVSLGGCGKDESLEVYKEDMNQFYEAVQEKSDAIDAIDPTSDTAIEELLGYLDDIDAEFTALGEMSVPEQFSAIESLADDAAAYMKEANQLYHQAYADGYYDDIPGEAARQNYERAMKRISYIADIFHGEIPEDANVTVITEDENGELIDSSEEPEV